MAGAADVDRSFDAARRLAGARLGRYLVGPRLGAGGTASVYLARLTGPHNFERLVALKVVHEHLAEEREFISQFLDEANLLVRLSHPNIVQVHELGREGHTLFLAIEYLDGQPLSKLMSALARAGERLAPELVAYVGARVADGLDFAHALRDEEGNPVGLVHRDVSPQNVFITYDGQVKLIDFGIARAAGRIAQTTVGKIKGKFSYMAPEQVLGSNFDHRVDLFALGATLYEAAVGSRLFAGTDDTETLHKLLFEPVPDVRTRVRDFPQRLAEILGHSLEAEPDRRFATGSEMARELDAFIDESGASGAKARLSELMKRLFAAERAKQAASIEELRASEHSDASVALSSDTTTPTLKPPKRRLWPWLAVGGVALAAAAVAIGAQSGPTDPQPATSAPSAAPVPSTVALDLSLEPDVDATIEVDGKAIEGKRAVLPRSDRSVTVKVQADGYEARTLELTPDRDRAMLVSLVKKAPTPPPSASEKPDKPRPVSTGHPSGTATAKGTGSPLVTKPPY